MTEVTTRALFSFPRVRILGRPSGTRGRTKEAKRKGESGVKGSEFVVTAGTDFIGLSSLYISLLQEVQPPHFHALEPDHPLAHSPFTLFIPLSLFSLPLLPLSSPSRSILTLPFNDGRPRGFFLRSTHSFHPSSASNPPPSRARTLPATLHRLFIRDSSYFLRVYDAISTGLCSRPPSGDKKHDPDAYTNPLHPETEIPVLLAPPSLRFGLPRVGYLTNEFHTRCLRY